MYVMRKLKVWRSRKREATESLKGNSEGYDVIELGKQTPSRQRRQPLAILS